MITVSQYKNWIIKAQSLSFSLKDFTHGGLGWSLLSLAWYQGILTWYNASHIMSFVHAILSMPFGVVYNFSFGVSDKTRSKSKSYNNEIISLIMVLFLGVFGLFTTIISYNKYRYFDYVMIYNLYTTMECLLLKMPIFLSFIRFIDDNLIEFFE